jgi:hypothetical protein
VAGFDGVAVKIFEPLLRRTPVADRVSEMATFAAAKHSPRFPAKAL